MSKFYYVTACPSSSKKFTTYEEAEKAAARYVSPSQGYSEAFILEAVATVGPKTPDYEVTKL